MGKRCMMTRHTLCLICHEMMLNFNENEEGKTVGEFVPHSAQTRGLSSNSAIQTLRRHTDRAPNFQT